MIDSVNIIAPCIPIIMSRAIYSHAQQHMNTCMVAHAMKHTHMQVLYNFINYSY